MGILEQITQMKNQGIPDADIIDRLREQGISPRAISDALSQAQIKSAITDVREMDYPQPQNTEQIFDNYSDTRNMPAPLQRNYDLYTPQTQEIPEQSYSQGVQEEYSPQEAYGDSSRNSADTLIEISEQVFSEKIKKFQKNIDEINEFKIIAQTKIENNAERLKRIEETLDRLQGAILEKIGSYGGNLESIKKEMSMMQDSFGKIINKVADKTERTHSTQRENIKPKKSYKK